MISLCFTQWTLPGGAYYREEANSMDLAARRQEIEDLVYEEDGVSMEGVREADADQEITIVPASAPLFVGPVDGQPVIPPTEGVRVDRDQLLVAQASELARQGAKSDTMQQAGIALEQELKALRQAYDAEALRASRAEALVEQLHLRDAESRPQLNQILDAKKCMEEIASDLRIRDLDRERSWERERAPWFDVNVKREKLPSQPSVSQTVLTSPDACVQVTPPLLSGFAAPKPPRYTGYSLEARRMFAKQYYEYCNECAQAAVSLGTKIGIRPIGTCIEAKAKSFAAMIHFGKDVALITNADWTQYFQYALNYNGPDFCDLEAKVRTTVAMDDKELDPDKCFDKWVYSYWALLDQNNMMSFHDKHPKNAVKALMTEFGRQH
ncbi:hypothetical protein DYB32_010900 [Aphanomyces invadans]|uniref:Uncharacterized protein n=1 Tax=Aphanomyces invadans TaxID=157072 RepID=A0A3R6ZGC4_9STRA|nr:hypothetical protein DYB32_010900 [Aphanomyces invadans]